MNFLFLTCRKASELIEKKSLFRLSMKEKFQLTMHTGMCKTCKKWESQSAQLDNTIKQHIHHQEVIASISSMDLSIEKKEEIIQSIKSHS